MEDEHFNWKDHVSIIKNKLFKNSDLLHKTKQFLNSEVIECRYSTFSQSYLIYENVSQCNTSMNQTKKYFNKQKQALKIIPKADIYKNLNPDGKMNHLDILNVYKANLYQVLNIML